MKEYVRKWIILEIIVFSGTLHIVLLLLAEYFLRRRELLNSCIQTITCSIVLILLFCLHELTVRIMERDVELMNKSYV